MVMKITYRPIADCLTDVDYLLENEEIKKVQAGYMHGICAYKEDRPVGVLLYHTREKRIIIDSIFVNEVYRRRGIGTGMMDMLFKAVKFSGKDLWVFFDGETIRDSFYRFLSSTHAFYIDRTEGFEAYITKEVVASLSKNYKKDNDAKLLFDAPMSMQMKFVEEMEKHYSTIAWELKNDNSNFYAPLCTYCAGKDGIEAVCLFNKNEDELELRLLYSQPGKGVAAARALIYALGELDEENAMPIRISIANNASKNILDKMCHEYTITKRFYSAYYIGTEE